MSALFSLSFYLCFLVVLALCLSRLSNQKVDKCMEGERRALLQFKQGLIDETDRLASWIDKDRNCCKWAGIACDNITGHVHGIHLEGSNYPLYGNLSSSLLDLKQLKHLDLSCNDFGGIQVPEFIGSFRNLRYLNLSASGFSGLMIPPQLGNLSRLHVLSVGSFQELSPDEDTRMMNMQWLSSLRLLHHLDMSGLDLSKAIDWFQVINTLPFLTELYLSRCDLMDIHPYVPSLNITSLSLLDLSYNDFSSFVPQWVFSITNLVSLDFSWCNFHSLIHGNIGSFRNLTSLKSLHVPGNHFMNSSLVLNGLSSTVASNLVSLKISFCGVSSSVLNSLHNFTSLRSLDLSSNDFGNISLNNLLGGFAECESHTCQSSPLEELDVTDCGISGTIPDFIGELTSMRRLLLGGNRISGQIPHWIGRLSLLERLDLSNNCLDGSLPDMVGNLSKLEQLLFSNNLLTGIITEAHFAKLASLNYLNGEGNKLTLRPRLANWVPPFQLWFLDLSSWSLGPQFPLWLHSQTQLITLYVSNTGISSVMPVSFWKSFPNLLKLDMSHNRIQGTLFDLPATFTLLDLTSNEFKGELPNLSNGSFRMLDLSNNLFKGSLRHLLCSDSVKNSANHILTYSLNLGNNHLSGIIPECWDEWQKLRYLNLENNHFFGEIPETLGFLRQLQLVNMHGNKLSGTIPDSLMNLKDLQILQIGRNKLVGSIPKWFGNLSSLRLLNLRFNNFVGDIPYELCYPTQIQILDLAHNYLSGNIPRCFNNFSVLSRREVSLSNQISFFAFSSKWVSGSDSLVMKGREDTYNSILGLVTLLDLSSNNLVGHIPSELMALRELKSLNLSRNQLTGIIPEKIGNMKSLETLDVSLNKLSGKLPMSLSNLTFLLSFNVSCNQLTGIVPLSTQLQSFSESSFFGNRLCGDPLMKRCIPNDVPNAEVQKDDDASHGADWGLTDIIEVGIVVGFWLIVAPLMVSRAWRVTYFRFLSELRYMVYDVVRKYGVNMFFK